MEGTMSRDFDCSRDEMEDSDRVSEIFVNSTYGAINNDDPNTERSGPILRKSPTTTQLMKTRVKRFFDRIVHCRYDKRKLPTSKQVVVLLLLCCFERAAYYAVTTIPVTALFQYSTLIEQLGITLVIHNVIPQLLFPIAGWVGDVYLGRFRAIQLGLILITLSCSSLLVETTVFYMVYPACSDGANPAHGMQLSCSHPPLTVCLVITFIVLYAGSSLFQANLIPYGADLITYYRSSNDISSYFYWYYWMRNVGGLIVSSLSGFCLLGLGNNLISVLSSLTGCIFISIALIVCYLTKHWFVVESSYSNPYKKSFQIISYALRAKRPKSRAAFGIGHDPPPRLDLAKRRHGGKFTNEEVEDVKTIGRLLLLFLCFGSINTVLIAADDALDFQVGRTPPVHLFSSTTGNINCSPTASYSWATGSLLILFLIPLLDQVIFPILGEFTPSMLRRMGVGFCAVILGCTVELGIEHTAAVIRNSNFPNITNLTCDQNLPNFLTSYYFLLIVPVPYLLLSLGEISSVIPGLCFVYAQSPSNTRGMMTGLFFAIAAVFSLLGAGGTTAAFKFLKPITDISQTCLFWYFLVVLCLSLVGLVVYIVAARMYKNRHRGELETSEPYYFRPRFLNIWGNRRGQHLRDYRENDQK